MQSLVRSNALSAPLVAAWLMLAPHDGFAQSSPPQRQPDSTAIAAATPEGRGTEGDPTTEQRRAATQLLDEYVRLAISNSPTLSAQRARQASAREMVQASGALPDPMVGAMYQSMGAPWRPMAPMSMAQAEVSQSIPGIGKRQARRNAAEADARLRELEVVAAKAQIAAQVRSLFAQIYASDREQHALEGAHALIELLVGSVAGQLAAGKADQEALARIATERSRLDEQLIDLRANREILVARLNRLLARRTAESVPRLEALPDIELAPDPLAERALGHAPELRLQRATVLAASRRRENAETETRPNFLFGLSGGATTTGEPIVTLRFGMELPIWRASKQDPMIRAAQKDVESAEGEYRAMELKLRSEIAELSARLQRDTAQIRLYRTSILPNTELALRAARDAYSTGRGSFAAVIEDFRQWLEARVGLSRREADRLMTWAELQALHHE